MKGIEIIDLSVPLSPEFPGCWPGNHPFAARTTSWYQDPDSPYFNRLITMEEHSGTHMDVPAHFVPGPHLNLPHSGPTSGITSEKVGLQRMIVPAVVLNATDLLSTGSPGQSPRIGRSRIEQFETVHGALCPGEGLLTYTGWSDRYYRTFPEGKHYAEIPVVERSVAG